MVDPSDPEWRSDFEKHYDGTAPMGRYRDMETLHYIFRGIESFTPWVRKVHFVTYGHTPAWLNLDHPKLNVVCHEDIIDEATLPIFNSGAIEMAFGNIEDLSEKFVYFNDDMFMTKPAAKDRFFRGELPKDFFQVRILFQEGLFSHSIHEHMSLIARTFTMKDVFKRRMFFKVFNFRYRIVANLRTFLSLIVSKTLSCFVLYHHPQPHLKRNIHESLQAYPVETARTQSNRFRGGNDLYQYIFRFWGLVNGRFHPYQPRDALYRTIESKSDIDSALEEAKSGGFRFVCFNDSPELTDDEYAYFKDRMTDFIDGLLPEPCSFEKTR